MPTKLLTRSSPTGAPKPKSIGRRRKIVIPRFYFPADYGGFTVDDDGEVFSTTAETEAHEKIVV